MPARLPRIAALALAALTLAALTLTAPPFAGQAAAAPKPNRPRAARAAPEAPPVFRAIYPRAPQTLDPHAEPDPAAWPVLMAAYDRLMTLEEGTARPRPALAQQARVSDNGLIYTFHLREDMTFADGTPLNAEAVLYSFDRLMATPVGRLYYPSLARFEALGEYTFRLILNQPWPPFLASLALPQASVVSPGLRHKPPDYLFAHTLGSGRYQVFGWKDDTLGLAARPDLPPRPVSKLLFHYEPDARARYEKMTRHGAHLAVEPDSGGEPWPDGFRPRAARSFSVRFMAFNTRRPYLAEPAIRRALAAIVGAAFQDRPGRLNSPFPEGLFYDAPGRASAPADQLADPLVQGDMVLAEAGPSIPPLLLIYKSGLPGLAADAQTVKEALTARGLAVNAQALDEGPWRRALEGGGYDLALADRTPEIPAADLWLGRFLDPTSSPEGNPAFFDHPGAVRLLRELEQAVKADPEDGANAQSRLAARRAGLLAELGRLAEAQAPYVFLYALPRLLALDERLERQRGGGGGPLPLHPMWPEVWPFELTDLTPAAVRKSGVNPTGRAPESQRLESRSPESPEAPGVSQTPPPAAPRPGRPEITPPSAPRLKDPRTDGSRVDGPRADKPAAPSPPSAPSAPQAPEPGQETAEDLPDDF